MSHTIQLPDEVYEAIAAYAAQHGQTPETAIQAWATTIRATLVEGAPTTSQDATTDPVNHPAYDPWAGFRARPPPSPQTASSATTPP
ncbi:MAG: hypothetical protein IVW57_14420 [Ktedonobacterales bacterium]|nr:hypothetical protein [Ktedonobacterales bacterium]